MVIFNSYVSLPEGKQEIFFDPLKLDLKKVYFVW
jgi:hypothetical protein